MGSRCAGKDRREHVASVLESIPRSDRDAIPLRRLCPSGVKEDPLCEGCVAAVLTMLEVFDSITVVRSEPDGEARVKAKSQTALYFLRSLAAYVRGGLTLVSNWEREGVGQGISVAQVLASGARLVYLMEHRRTVEHGDLSPVREE